ncbi:hypothetical protein ACTVJH_13440 [Desulfoplanes sp. PS50]|jgi:hypothetical protein
MRDMTVNDVLKKFNRYYLDATLEDEFSILGIGEGRHFKRDQFSELYRPLFVTLWVHALDNHQKEHSDTIRDAYLKGLKACFRKQKGEYERMVGLVIEYEAMLGDFSEASFRFTAEQIVKKISRNTEALAERSERLSQKMIQRLNDLMDMTREMIIITGS